MQRPRTADRRLARRAVGAALLLALASLAVVACGSDAPEARATTSRAAATSTTDAPGRALAIDVELVDFGFDSPSEVEEGYVDLAVTNRGDEPHEVQLGRLHDGVTWDQVEETLHGDAPDAVGGLLTMVGGTGALEPGEQAASTVRLEAGDYGVFCFVVGADGTSHLAHGMAKPLDVTPASAGATAAAAPTSKGTIVLKDMAIELPEGFDGTGTWKVVNEGEQPHQALLLRYADGATDADVDAYLTATSAPAGPPPALAVGGAGAISKGEEEWIDLDLPKGTYRWLCFVPDPQKGFIPHAMEGMQTTWSSS